MRFTVSDAADAEAGDQCGDVDAEIVERQQQHHGPDDHARHEADDADRPGDGLVLAERDLAPVVEPCRERRRHPQACLPEERDHQQLLQPGNDPAVEAQHREPGHRRHHHDERQSRAARCPQGNLQQFGGRGLGESCVPTAHDATRRPEHQEHQCGHGNGGCDGHAAGCEGGVPGGVEEFEQYAPCCAWRHPARALQSRGPGARACNEKSLFALQMKFVRCAAIAGVGCLGKSPTRRTAPLMRPSSRTEASVTD
jgi:hypothetical protein